MHSTLAVRALRSIHPPSAAFRTAARGPMMASAARPVPVSSSMAMARAAGMSPMGVNSMLARRWNTQENKGGRAKLVCFSARYYKRGNYGWAADG